MSLRAPPDDLAFAAEPELAAWPGLVQRFAPPPVVRLAGVSLTDLVREQRRATLAAAHAFARVHGEPAPADSFNEQTPVIASGHQPELFHAGVWIKNVAVNRLAERTAAIPLHVLADHDLAPTPSAPVPFGDAKEPALAWEAFDRLGDSTAAANDTADGAGVPFEERRVLDETVFGRFGSRVSAQLAEVGLDSVISQAWKATVKAGAITDRLGERLAAGRRALERELGIQSFDVPLSRLALGAGFRALVLETLTRADEFRDQHNRLLGEFRAERKIRSRHHPAPDLVERQGFLETPWWTWHPDSPRRRRLFARVTSAGVELRADDHAIGSLPRSLDPFEASSLMAPGAPARGPVPPGSVDDPIATRLGGWKIRPRALMATGFLRLLVSDLFVHGIGGAIYDQLTDRLLKEFLGVHPPPFVTITATLRLPLADGDDDPALTHRELAARLRDRHWNADRHVPDTMAELPPLVDWIERKRALMEEEPNTRAARVARFKEFRRLNDRLRPHAGGSESDLRAALADAESRVARSAWLNSREFPWCWHSIERLRALSNRVRFSA